MLVGLALALTFGISPSPAPALSPAVQRGAACQCEPKKKSRRRFFFPIAGGVGVLPLALAARDSQLPMIGAPGLVDIVAPVPRTPIEGELALEVGALAPDTATILPTLMVVSLVLTAWGVHLTRPRRRRVRAGAAASSRSGRWRLRTIYRRRAGLFVASVGALTLVLGTREYAEGAYTQHLARQSWDRAAHDISAGQRVAAPDGHGDESGSPGRLPAPLVDERGSSSRGLVPLPSASRGLPRRGEPVARLVIDAIDLDEIVLEGVGAVELNGGPGHYPGSALPGEPGNAIVSAHRDRHFRRFGELVVGTRIRTETLTGSTEWVVTERRIVSRNTPALFKEPEATLTLTTCWPLRYFGPAPDRLIVVAKPVGSRPTRD